jgi:Aspartyl protease
MHNLKEAILNRENWPETIEDWERMAREEQVRELNRRVLLVQREAPKPPPTQSRAPRHIETRTPQRMPPVQINITTTTPSVRQKKPKTALKNRTCYHCRVKGHEKGACPNKHLPRVPNQTERRTPSPSTSEREVVNILEPRTRSTPGQQSQTYAQVCRTQITTTAPPVTTTVPRAEPAKVARLLKKMTPDQRKEVMDLLPEDYRPVKKITIGFVRHRGVRSINMPFTFRSVLGSVGEAALVDSGASENFIDQRTVTRWGIATRPLPIPVTVTNVDGTSNRDGAVRRYAVLHVTQGNKSEELLFLVANLGRDRVTVRRDRGSK